MAATWISTGAWRASPRRWRPPRHCGSRDCRGRQWFPAHRPAAIDQQAVRRRRLHPASNPQPIGIERAGGRERLGDALQAPVEIEVAAVGCERERSHRADAFRPHGSATGDVKKQPGSEPLGPLAQLCVAGRGQVGEQRHHLVG